MSVCVFGVDYDSHRVAICRLEHDRDAATFTTVHFRRRNEDAFQAVRNAAKAIEFLTRTDPGRAGAWWIEHAFGSGPSDFILGRVQGAILSALPDEAAASEVGPSEWKKGIGLGGNTRKAAYQPQLRDMAASGGAAAAAATLSEHELDAFGIALYGRTVNRLAVSA